MNEPAFPPTPLLPSGISLRDFFAVFVVASSLPTNFHDALASQAYAVADALMRARAEGAK
jgi:hypothetical protein